jgi:hypothetical protein
MVSTVAVVELALDRSQGGRVGGHDEWAVDREHAPLPTPATDPGRKRIGRKLALVEDVARRRDRAHAGRGVLRPGEIDAEAADLARAHVAGRAQVGTPMCRVPSS